MATIRGKSLRGRVAYEPGVKKAWRKTRPTGGTCFTVSFDQITRILRERKALSTQDEVLRYEVDETGVTVFLTPESELRPANRGPRVR